MKGDYVIVRYMGDKPALRRIVDVYPRCYYVCAPEHYDKIVREQADPPYIGVPRGDVYEYSPDMLAYIEANYQQGDFAWSQLTPYSVRETA